MNTFRKCVACPPTCTACKIDFSTKKLECSACVDGTTLTTDKLSCIKTIGTALTSCDTSLKTKYVKKNADGSLTCEDCKNIVPSLRCSKCDGFKCLECIDETKLSPVPTPPIMLLPPCMLPGDGKTIPGPG
jgi:hypothetical protein